MNLLTTQASLVAVIVGVATAVAVLIRGRQALALRYVYFALSVSAFYFASFLRSLVHAVNFDSVHMGLAAVVLVTGTGFFQTLLSDHGVRAGRRGRLAWLAALVLMVLALTPLHQYTLVRVLAVLLALLPLGALVWITEKKARDVDSRVERWRLRYVTVGGMVVLIVVTIDLISTLGLDLPRTGGIAVAIYLYFLSQVLERRRLLDLHELLAKAAVFSVLGFILASVYGLLVLWAPEPTVFIFNTMLASALILILFDPLRAWLENFFANTFFAQQRDFARVLQQLAKSVLGVTDPEHAQAHVLDSIYNSGRVTHCALYSLNQAGAGLELVSFRGARPEATLEPALDRTMLNALEQERVPLAKDSLSVEYDNLHQREPEVAAHQDGELSRPGRLHALLQALEAMRADVVIPVVGQGRVIGALCLRDERVSQAFASDELRLLTHLTDLLAIALENSRVLEELRERERLVLLGELATGLVHKIREPLQRIKQLLSAQAQAESDATLSGGDSKPTGQVEQVGHELLGLEQILDQFVRYAQPVGRTFAPFDLSVVAAKSLNLLRAESGPNVHFVVELEANLPTVSGDVEQIYQVIAHLLRNALVAIGNKGQVWIRSEHHKSSLSADPGELVLSVRDDGAGIDPEARAKLFDPFFSTWEGRPGLGLAFSQRIAEAHGGRIGLRSKPGEGAEFSLHLPLATGPRASGRQSNAQGGKENRTAEK